ncbi:MAG: FAD-dependent oxidoreductase [Bilophila wadsworthia]
MLRVHRSAVRRSRRLFRPTVSRSSGDPEEISAGAGVGYFLLVWDKSSGLARNIVGGAATLPQAIAHTLGDKVKLGAEVLEVIQHRDHVEVTYKSDGKEATEQARHAAITTPAAITHRITKPRSPVHDALGKIQYGHYVSGAFLTNETGRRPWDSVYAYCTPQRSFNIAFNMSNLVRTMESERQPGSSFMVFSPAKLARDLINLPDEKVLEIYRKDLEEVFPGLARRGAERPKFHLGSPTASRAQQLQPLLMRTPRRIYLAGDYLGSWYTETAIQTGLLAGEDINSKLYTDTCCPPTASPTEPLHRVSFAKPPGNVRASLHGSGRAGCRRRGGRW